MDSIQQGHAPKGKRAKMKARAFRKRQRERSRRVQDSDKVWQERIGDDWVRL